MAIAHPVTLTFLGAAGTVTGSKYLLTIGERRILVDAGMFQGEKEWRLKNWEPLPVDAASITDVLLTHAHTDHSAYLPALVRQGFTGPIWATDGTIALTEIVLRDSAKLQESATKEAIAGGYSKHAAPVPLYDGGDVEATLPLFREVEFDAPLDLGDGVSATWVRAGHILASASIRVETPETSVLFSGDLGRHDHPILKPRATPRGAAYVVMESTYGDREHPEPEVPHEPLADAIRRTIERGGAVVMPAFAIDRTEVILYALSQMMREGRIPVVPVIVDGPMALKALEVYTDTSLDELRDGVSVTDFARLPTLEITRTSNQSKALNKRRDPRIIVSSSGMAEGGRVLHHLARLLPDARNTVVLTGFQAAGTRGRALEEGAREVKINGHYVRVRAEIVRDAEFSVHGDASDLLDWVRALDPAPETVFVTHGEPDVARILADRIEDDLDIDAAVATYGEVVSLLPAIRDEQIEEVPEEG
ncbi:MBL fold metallo-hydrolase RNA specificity domain-containing protein [Kribbia dieselivorans]|uniref:MBL fold metallo-hydrolase RNA specificity domain-containing protein n=1 Tax=Kribbia dieselivorans TaxID=331526 RepID=UPI00083888B3|nr:MBL fold metallo-hydrolase [Kribbia dieselivorans]